jgi:hypothetical protein
MNKTCSCGQSWPYRLTCLLEKCTHRVSVGVDFIAVNSYLSSRPSDLPVATRTKMQVLAHLHACPHFGSSRDRTSI